jgi:hypothetical protein
MIPAMKRFALFSVVAVLAAVLTHLITGWCGLEDTGTVVLLIPIGVVFMLFYVRGSARQQ